MKRKNDILKENVFVNEYGVEIIKRLIKSYKVLSTGFEFDIEYIYIETIDGQSCCFKPFKKLANAEKFCKDLF